MQRFSPFVLAILVSLLVIVAGLLHALKQHPPYAPQINSQQQANATFEGQQNTEGGSQSAAKTNEQHGGKHTEQGDNEGTEFWPALLGVRLKITDSLLAAFTLGLLIFTGLLWKSTDKLWKATIRTLQISQQEFISTHRPRITVRKITVVGEPKNGEPVWVSYRIINSGESAASILEENASMLTTSLDLPGLPPYDKTKTASWARNRLESGQSLESRASIEISADRLLHIQRGSMQLYIFGFVRYVDDNGTVREMAYGRKYDRVRKSFDAVPYVEYEYAD
jgi:heme exporter protein D